MSDDTTKLFYESQAEKYAETTQPVRLEDLWNTLSSLLPEGAYLLDLGCGAGRDLKELAQRGFRVVGIEYSAALARIAQQYSNQQVWVADFRYCDLGESKFHGIWAVASLLHVSRKQIPPILKKLYVALRPGGILLTSMKKGDVKETSEDGRHFEFYQPEEWEGMLKTAGFEIERHHASSEKRHITPTSPQHIEWFVTIARKNLYP